jgi:glutathione S-transferase
MPELPTRSVTLYGPSRAPYTEKVRRALVLKGVPFELREPSGPEDYRRWSPKTGLLPVLTLDDELVSDSTDILLRLDELHPDPPLLASDPTAAGQQRRLEDWADESFLWYFQQWVRLSQAQATGESAQPRRGTPTWLRRLGAWLRTGGTWERPETALLRGMEDRLGDLVNFLGTRRFFYADRISMADLAVYGMLLTMRNDWIPGSARLLAMRPALLEFMRRVEEETGG